MSGAFDLHFDLHLWVQCLVLRLCLSFFLHLVCTAFWHLDLALSFPLAWNFTLIAFNTSLTFLPCSWNPSVLHLVLVCLPYVMHQQLLCVWVVLHPCLASLIFLSCTVNSNVYPYILHLCRLPLSCPSNNIFGLHVLNLPSMCFTIIL